MILSGLERGQRWCTAACRPYADLWRRAWSKLEDIGQGPHGVQVGKVKAHVSRRRAAGDDAATQNRLKANREVDLLAKRGAQEGTNVFRRGVSLALDAEAGKVKGALDLLRAFVDQQSGESWPDVDPAPRGGPRQARAQSAPAAMPDQREERHGRPAGHAAAALRVQRGPGDGQARAQGHALWRTGPVVWCARCGKYARQAARALLLPCRGAAQNTDRWVLGNLRAGRMPKASRADAAVGVPRVLTCEEWQAMGGSDGATQ